MELIKTNIPDLVLLKPKIFEDQRGYFFESYNKKTLLDIGLNYIFVQDNQSKSQYGVIRGLHFQIEPYAQAKLIRAIQGTIYDVAVDLRKGSPTFGKWQGFELSVENKLQLLIPRGFAHGFSVLSQYAEIMYKCDNYYHPEADSGIKYNDKSLNIDWKIPNDKTIVSDKDKQNVMLNNAKINFIYDK